MSDLLLKVGSIAALLGGLIFVHELGHFVVAKLFRVKVLKFSLGFGPKIWGFRRGETEYRLALLPLGGYVKMAGDDPTEPLPPEDRGRGFLEQSPWRRFLIAFAGPGVNLVFPVFLFFAIAMLHNGAMRPAPRIGSVSPGSPAAAAGLQPADRILSVEHPAHGSRPVRYWSDLQDLVAPHPGEKLLFTVERGGQRISLPIVPAREEERNILETTVRGVIGVTPVFSPAIVLPAPSTQPTALLGASGELEPFDLVVKVAGKPVAHWGELANAWTAAGCAPVDVEILREEALPMPGAALTLHRHRSLKAVPTCAGGKLSIFPADPNVSTVIAAVTPGSPADQAGLKRGDAIAAVDGKPVRSFREVNALGIALEEGKPVQLALADGRSVQVVPQVQTHMDELSGKVQRRLQLGFHPDRREVVSALALVAEQVPQHIGFLEAARISVEQVITAIRITVLGITRIVQGEISFRTVGGPIMLFSITAEAAEDGLDRFVHAMAMISVNLGLMNLFPIPVLDGGHIVACIIEAIRRRPLSLRTREIANLAGMVLLLGLMVAVFYNDILRYML
jgi:regulator of sigma E protease